MNRPVAETVLNPVVMDAEIRRSDLRSDPSCRFVNWTEFAKLLISRSVFERSDDAEAAVLGLRNAANGDRFLIEVEAIHN